MSKDRLCDYCNNLTHTVTIKCEELVVFIEGLDMVSMAIDGKAFTETMLKLGLPYFPCEEEVLETWAANIHAALINLQISSPLPVPESCYETCESLRLYARVRLGVINGQINI